LRLRDKYNLNYLVHNYFPPPKQNFVLNLASLDDIIYEESIQHLFQSIRLCRKIGSSQFGFHAGFFVDLDTNEIGKVIQKKHIENRELSIQRFCEAFKKLQDESRGIDLYLENHIYSYSNFRVFGDQAPFMLLTYKDYIELRQRINFKLLLDLAHLKVSVNTLELNHDDEFEKMMNASDYLHISENNGKQDQNMALDLESDMISILKEWDIKEKTITLEIYNDMETIIRSRNILDSIIDESNSG
jgi:sugar phosphate isomerase/epimerase